mmetsp:Transcript_529/g.1813  ORF Transcript_529/g.1813 Transcript_529/m.1813 type:complete len:756 (-) Transcript_529:141-2408(-)
MGKKKPVNATVDELNEARDALQAAIDQLRAEAATKAQCQGDRAQLESQISNLTQAVSQNATRAEEAIQNMGADSRQHGDAAADGAFDKAHIRIQELDAARRQAETGLENRLDEVDKGMRTAFVNELTSLCETLDKQLAELRQELVDLVELRASQSSEALLALRRHLEDSLEGERRSLADAGARLKADAVQEVQRLRQEMQRAHDRMDSQAAGSRTELDERISALSSTVYQNRCDLAGSVSELRKDASASLGDFRKATEDHLAALDRCAATLTDGVSEVRNAATRRVEWLIPAASKTLQVSPDVGADGHASWRSPRFHAAGARNLQLELRRFPCDAAADGVSAADCAMYLWGHKGMHIACRLFVGSKSSTIEKAYSSHAAHGTRRLCSVRDQISAEGDTLRVGVELLEVVREDPAPPATLPDDDRGRGRPGGGGGGGPFEGSLTCHRHINNRVLPAVRKEVERMQARMVRRTEWLLEQASSLPLHFPNRQYICSPIFSAAGVDGMQLIFYPAGYMGASEGFCSLFIYCPAGVSLKATLAAGKQKREANYLCPDGGAFGRTNFCRYEGLFDEASDTLLIVFEIDECKQDITTVVGDSPAIGGEVKQQRLPGQVALVETKVLPSLWSTKGLGDVGGRGPDAGYHSFNALKGRPKAGGGRPTAQAAAEPEEEGSGDGVGPLATAAPVVSPLQRSTSTPLHTPGGSGHSPRKADFLPALTATPGGDWGGEKSSSVRIKKSRSSRRPVSLAAPPLLAAAPC